MTNPDCFYCHGIGWIKTTIKVDAKVYGQPRELSAATPCTVCAKRNTQLEIFDGKAAAAK